jgi:hypothetical protein
MSKKTLNKCDELIERLTELKKVINALSNAQPSQQSSRPSKTVENLSKKYTPAQLAAIEEAKNLKKNYEKLPWVSHSNVPNADAEVRNLQRTNPVSKGEDALANQLSSVMAGKNMLGIKPPPQPTNEQMFGHLVPSEEQLQKAEHDWNNRFNWLQEAMKPISSRFKTPEEEEAYWRSIKVTDKDDGKPGY